MDANATDRPDLAELLGQVAWARRLARELTRDEAAAEDALQEAFVAALEHPPRRAGNPRGWLARVLTNAVRGRGRAEARRTRRERSSARPEALPSTAELAEELDWQRRMAGAVLELEEPYRATLILRFYRDLSPGEIARRTGVPAGTVRSRLKRGLDKLRGRFDEEHGGDRSSWSLVLAGWAGRDGLNETPRLAATVWLGPLLLAAAAVLGWRLWSDPEPMAGERVVIGDVALGQGVGAIDVPEPSAAPPLARRSALALDEEPRATHAEGPLVIGQIQDPDGAPVEGARVEVFLDWSFPRPDPIGSSESGADGRFAVPIGATEAEESAAAMGLLVTARADGFSASEQRQVLPGHEVSIRLNWLVDVGGVVRDARSGSPLEGVELRWDDPSGGAPLVTLSDSQGRYRVRVPAGLASPVQLRLGGYASRVVELLARDRQAPVFDLELEPGVPIEVEVFDQESGLPLPSVAVRGGLGGEPWTHTDALGRFVIDEAAGEQLSAELRLAGYCPVGWEWRPTGDELPGSPRLPMVRPAWIEGRLQDDTGSPIEGASVYVVDGRGLPLDFGSTLSAGPWGTVRAVAGHLRRRGSGPEESGAPQPTFGPGGYFRLPVVPGDTEYVLHARSESHLPAERGPLQLARSSDGLWVDLELTRGAKVSGTARCSGRPVYGGRLEVRAADGTVRFSTMVDEDYELVVPAGTWTLALLDDRETVRRTSSLVAEAGETYERDFLWGDEEALGTISGRVLPGGGELPEGVVVHANPIAGTGYGGGFAPVGTDGRYVVRVSRAGPHAVQASRPADRGRQVRGPVVEAIPGAEAVDLLMPETGWLRLQLVDATTCAPVRLGESPRPPALRWKSPGDESFQREGIALDLRGELSFEVAAGACEVQLDLGGTGYLPVPPRILWVPVGPDGEPHVIRCERGLEAHLRFAGPAGARLTDGRLVFLVERSQSGLISGPYPRYDPRANRGFGGIAMRLDDPALMHQRLLHAGGLLRGLRPGSYVLRSFPDDIVFEPPGIDVAGPERTERTVVWSPRGP